MIDFLVWGIKWNWSNRGIVMILEGFFNILDAEVISINVYFIKRSIKIIFFCPYYINQMILCILIYVKFLLSI